MTVRSFAAVCLLALGVLVVVIAAVGMFRFRRTLELLQASALADTLGLLLILAGLALLCGFTVHTAKLVLLVVILWAVNPVSAHLDRPDGGHYRAGYGAGPFAGERRTGTVTGLELLLLSFLIFCAVATVLCRRLVSAVIIFMSYSAVMSILWFLLESPDLAITEAAVGAGVTSLLFFLTLRKINALKGMERDEE